MTPDGLLAELEARGVELFVSGGFLRYRGRRGAYDLELRAEVDRLRENILANWLCPRCSRATRIFYGFPPLASCRRCFDKAEAERRCRA